MLARQSPIQRLLRESKLAHDSYFGNPYNLAPEQSCLVHLDRHGQQSAQQDGDELEAVVILGYN